MTCFVCENDFTASNLFGGHTHSELQCHYLYFLVYDWASVVTFFMCQFLDRKFLAWIDWINQPADYEGGERILLQQLLRFILVFGIL